MSLAKVGLWAPRVPNYTVSYFFFSFLFLQAREFLLILKTTLKLENSKTKSRLGNIPNIPLYFMSCQEFSAYFLPGFTVIYSSEVSQWTLRSGEDSFRFKGEMVVSRINLTVVSN